jgi:hypothetical protein
MMDRLPLPIVPQQANVVSAIGMKPMDCRGPKSFCQEMMVAALFDRNPSAFTSQPYILRFIVGAHT